VIRDDLRDELRAILDEDPDPSVPITEDEQWLLRHFAAVAAVLPYYAERYRGLLARRESEGSSADLRAMALEAAGTIAIVMQSVRRRQALVLSTAGGPVDPQYALAMLGHLFYSFTLLTGAAQDAYMDAIMTADELDAAMSLEELDGWLREVGAFDREAWPPAGEDEG